MSYHQPTGPEAGTNASIQRRGLSNMSQKPLQRFYVFVGGGGGGLDFQPKLDHSEKDGLE